MWFITKQKVISPYQTAVKQQHSTLDSFLRIHHYASDALSTKNHVTILATDFERAFNRVVVLQYWINFPGVEWVKIPYLQLSEGFHDQPFYPSKS